MNKRTVKQALDRLRAQGKVYIKASDVAETVGKDDVTSGEKGHISRLLAEMDTVEKWGRSKNITWRLKGGGKA